MGQVVAYGISINLVEVTWKSKIKAQFPNPNDYSAFMGDFSSATGAVTFIMMLLSRFIFRKVHAGAPPACMPARAPRKVMMRCVSQVRVTTWVFLRCRLACKVLSLLLCSGSGGRAGLRAPQLWQCLHVATCSRRDCCCGLVIPCTAAHEDLWVVLEPVHCLASLHMGCPGAQYGWGVAAIITPTVLLITGVAFFGLVLGSGPLTPTLASIGLTPLMAAVLVRQRCFNV